MRRLLAGSLAAAVLGTIPAVASAATEWTLDKVVTLRNAPHAFVLGTLYGNGQGPNTPHSDHFEQQASSGTWIYGASVGSTGRWGGLSVSCGWVLPRAGAMHPNGRSGADRCPAPSSPPGATGPLSPASLYTPGSWFLGTGGGTVYPGRVTASAACAAVGGAHAYGNFDPPAATFSSRYGLEADGRGTRTTGGRGAPSGYSGFGLRAYAGDAVLVKDSKNTAGAGDWFFMRRQCVAPIGPLASSGLSITTARWKGRTVAFRGRAARDLPQLVGTAQQSLAVAFRCAKATATARVGFHRATIAHKHTTVWKARLRTPTGCTHARTGTAGVGFAGEQLHKPQIVTRRVRRS